MKRSNKNMKHTKCKKCGGRIYLHRIASHICNLFKGEPKHEKDRDYVF